MACYWALLKGAKRVIEIDNNWRADFAKSKLDRLETINFATLKSGETVLSKIHELVPGGVDVSIDATGGEYAKGWAHKLELMIGAEQDTSEMINECIVSTRKFSAVGIIGDYIGCKFFSSKEQYTQANCCSHEPFQRRVTHGTRCPSHWMRPGSGSQVYVSP